MTIDEAISLLGTSERDVRIQNFLKGLSVKLPLKRPRRGEDQVNVVIENKPLELCFVTAESLANHDEFLEGELILGTVFVQKMPNASESVALEDVLPFGLRMGMSRSEARQLFGTPVWSSPVLNNDRWLFGDIKVLACFTADELSVSQLAFSKV